MFNGAQCKSAVRFQKQAESADLSCTGFRAHHSLLRTALFIADEQCPPIDIFCVPHRRARLHSRKRDFVHKDQPILDFARLLAP